MFDRIPKDRRTISVTPRRSRKHPTADHEFVATKTADQLDLQLLHRVRERLVSQRTGAGAERLTMSDTGDHTCSDLRTDTSYLSMGACTR
jgi:hypothetical protein